MRAVGEQQYGLSGCIWIPYTYKEQEVHWADLIPECPSLTLGKKPLVKKVSQIQYRVDSHLEKQTTVDGRAPARRQQEETCNIRGAHVVLVWDDFSWGVSKSNNIRLHHRILTIFDHSPPTWQLYVVQLNSMALRAIWKKVSRKKMSILPKGFGDGAECRAVLGDIEERFAGWALWTGPGVCPHKIQHASGVTDAKPWWKNPTLIASSLRFCDPE